MSNLRGTLARLSSLLGALVLTVITAPPAFAGGALGGSLGIAFGNDLSVSVPIVEGGLLALLATGVVGGVYLARRKR